MNKSVEQILRESREKRRKTLEIRRVNHSNDVVMKNSDLKSRQTRNFKRNISMNRRYDEINRNKQNNFKTKKSFGIERGRKNIKKRINNTALFISNLNLDTTNSDLKTLFESIGPLKRCGINWNELGQSKGTADVVFFERQHAKEAINKFNSGVLKGVPIKIQWNRKMNGVINRNIIRNGERDPRLRKRLGRRRIR